MKRVLILLGPLLFALGACSSEPVDDPTVVTVDPSQTASTPAAAAAPPAPQPSGEGTCPYLEESAVEETNGQRVSKVEISADQPPACFFYRSDGTVQLTVWVYSGEAAVAKAVVDQAAPVASSNPAELTGGWQGGALSSDTGAVYAVAKDTTAVVVSTNQGQTIKAKQIAQESITALGL